MIRYQRSSFVWFAWCYFCPSSLADFWRSAESVEMGCIRLLVWWVWPKINGENKIQKCIDHRRQGYTVWCIYIYKFTCTGRAEYSTPRSPKMSILVTFDCEWSWEKKKSHTVWLVFDSTLHRSWWGHSSERRVRVGWIDQPFKPQRLLIEVYRDGILRISLLSSRRRITSQTETA